MVHGVVAYDVAFVHHTPHQISILLDVIAYQKKSRRGVVLFQYIQNLFRCTIFVAGIKGEIDDFLIGVANVGSVILMQLTALGRGGRWLAFGLKGQSPGTGFYMRLPKLRNRKNYSGANCGNCNP